MKSQAILVSVLVLPLMLLACNRADHSPAPSAGTGMEKKATTPPAMDKPQESPPGAQTPSGGAMSPDSAPPSEQKKN